MIRDDIKAATDHRDEGRRQGRDAARSAWSRRRSRTATSKLRTGSAPKDDDALVTEVLQKMIKQRRELAEIYRKGGREERAAAEEAEIAVIERFLPAQMSDAEAEAAIRAIIAETGAVVDEGHGPRDGAGEGAPRRLDRAGAGQRAGQGRAVLSSMKKGPAASSGGARNRKLDTYA